MQRTYQHTLRYSELANARPLFQNYIDVTGQDSNLNRTSKRYYSSQDVSIYFGDFFIDDACYVDYAVSESAMLLYGYNSYVFDDIAKGSRMVQGQFAIQFTCANYLSKVLSDISQYKGTGLITHSRYHALWPIGFDLLIHHGSKEHSNKYSNDLQIVLLRDIYITNVSMQYDSSTGQPIREVYTFVGRDVNFGAELENAQEKEEVKPETPHVDKIEFVRYTNKQVKVQLSESAYINHISYCFGEDNLKFKTLSIDSTKAVMGFTIDVDPLIVASWIDGKAVIHLRINYRDYPLEEHSSTLAIQ